MHPSIFILLVRNITLPFSIESANGPTNGAKKTYETVKNSFSKGVIQLGASISTRIEIATMRRALSAKEEKNWANIIV